MGLSARRSTASAPPEMRSRLLYFLDGSPRYPFPGSPGFYVECRAATEVTEENKLSNLVLYPYDHFSSLRSPQPQADRTEQCHPALSPNFGSRPPRLRLLECSNSPVHHLESHPGSYGRIPSSFL